MIARLMVVAASVAAAAAGVGAWARRRGGNPPRAASSSAKTERVAARPAGADAGDNLQAIKGIGSVSEQRLSDIGVTMFSEIAAWSEEDIERIAKDIKVSAERIKREDWVGQASAFAAR